MDYSSIDQLMLTGDFVSAAGMLKDYLAEHPKDAEARLRLGTCRAFLGDETLLAEEDDRLARDSSVKEMSGWKSLHALRVAACGAALLMSGAVTADCRVCTLYGTPSYCYTVQKPTYAPRPSATDGTYSGYVRLTWSAMPNVAYYKIRRATSPDYSRSKTIATVYNKNSYKDEHPACRTRKKYYYWIVPYSSCGEGKKDTTRYDVGYTKQKLTVSTPPTLYVGDQYSFRVRGGACDGILPSDCTWRITLGGTCASISRSGVLKAKKAGMVKISITFNKTTVSKTVNIQDRKDCPFCGLRE